MIILGSTGSIGLNALFLARKFGLKITALSCGKNVMLLNEQIAKFQPKFVCISEDADKSLLKFDKKRVFVGQSGLEKMLEICPNTLIINAIVGFAGLRASLKAKNLKRNLALANKESLVVAGRFLSDAKISPIDSEHAALKFLLKGRKKALSRLIITASGGAVRNVAIKDLAKLDAKAVLKHPNWQMGAKITIDSATMVNKLFEIIEAFHLFKFRDIDALIEPQSMIHAMCEFKDGGVSAYFSRPDMKLAIAQAILPHFNIKLNEQIVQNLDFLALKNLEFHPINLKKYPIFSLKNALLKNPDLGVLINGANEVLVQKFLQNEIKFTEISTGIFRVLDKFGTIKISSINEIFEFDLRVREFLKALK